MSMQISATRNITAAELANMDITTALMAVQSDRVRLLDDELKDQLKLVSNRNDQIAKLTDLKSALNDLSSKETDATKVVGGDAKLLKAAQDAATAAGYTLDPALTSTSKKSDVESLITKITGKIDSESNTQQIDMLRLQSLSNKRTEAYDLMSTMAKKDHDLKEGTLNRT